MASRGDCLTGPCWSSTGTSWRPAISLAVEGHVSCQRSSATTRGLSLAPAPVGRQRGRVSLQSIRGFEACRLVPTGGSRPADGWPGPRRRSARLGRRAIWFGSRVNGIPAPGSDVDLCLVLARSEKHRLAPRVRAATHEDRLRERRRWCRDAGRGRRAARPRHRADRAIANLESEQVSSYLLPEDDETMRRPDPFPLIPAGLQP